MSKSSIVAIIISIVAIGIWVGITVFVNTEPVSAPTVNEQWLAPLDPSIPTQNQDEFSARSENRIGKELEL